MYAAKREGKNRVQRYGHTEPPLGVGRKRRARRHQPYTSPTPW